MSFGCPNCLLQFERVHFIVRFAVHEFYNMFNGTFHITGVPVGTFGLLGIHHIQHEQIPVAVQLQDLSMSLCHQNGTVDGVALVQIQGICQYQRIPVFQLLKNFQHMCICHVKHITTPESWSRWVLRVWACYALIDDNIVVTLTGDIDNCTIHKFDLQLSQLGGFVGIIVE